MKVQILTEVLGYDNKSVPTKDEDSGKMRPLTWKDVATIALNNVGPENKVMTGEQIAKSYAVSNKIYASKEPDLTVNELAYIIERIDVVYTSPLICGRAKEFFNDWKASKTKSKSKETDQTNEA